MTKLARALSLMAGTALALALPATPAQAQANRTWVSRLGNDANPCSQTQPA